MRTRKHHNNKGYAQIKKGKTREQIERIKKRLKKIINNKTADNENNSTLRHELFWFLAGEDKVEIAFKRIPTKNNVEDCDGCFFEHTCDGDGDFMKQVKCTTGGISRRKNFIYKKIVAKRAKKSK